MHTIDLQTLESALSEISEVGHVEHTFSVEGKVCVLHPLNSDSEREIFEYSQLALEGADPDDQNDQASSISYMDRFKIATISHSLVMFGNLDLRGVEKVPTGGSLPSGGAEYILRYQAIRKIVEKWSKPLVEQFFIQFGELTRRVEEKASKSVVYEPSDVDAEIERLRDQLKWLSDQVSRLENPDEGQSKKIRDAILESTRLKQQHRKNLVAQGRMSPDMLDTEDVGLDLPEPTPTPEAPQAFPDSAQRPVPPPRARVEPKPPRPSPPRHDPPPAAGEFETEPQGDHPQEPSQHHQDPDPGMEEGIPHTPQGRPAAPPPPRGQAPRQEPPEQEPSFEERFREENPDIGPEEDLLKYTPTGDSMIGDDEEASIAAEMARLAAQRQRRVEQELADQRAAEQAVEARRQAAPADGGAPGQQAMSPAEKLFQQRHGGKLPPHAAARQTAAQVGMGTPVPDNAPMTAHRPPGQTPSEAYQISEPMPLTKRTKAADDNRSSTVDADVVDGGSNNPRFVGRGQGGGRRR